MIKLLVNSMLILPNYNLGKTYSVIPSQLFYRLCITYNRLFRGCKSMNIARGGMGSCLRAPVPARKLSYPVLKYFVTRTGDRL